MIIKNKVLLLKLLDEVRQCFKFYKRKFNEVNFYPDFVPLTSENDKGFNHTAMQSRCKVATVYVSH